MSDEHVVKRDGRTYAGEPFRPAPLELASQPAHSGDAAYFKSDDPMGVKGSFPGRSADCGKAGFERLPGGRPSPRQRLARGEKVVAPGQTAGEPPRTVPAPLD
jgi:hypothetical protein